MARIKVRLFARLREEFGKKEVEIDAKSVEEVVRILKISDEILIAVNNKLIDCVSGIELEDGDVVDLMPPFSGG